jgi:hypothetical protein
MGERVRRLRTWSIAVGGKMRLVVSWDRLEEMLHWEDLGWSDSDGGAYLFMGVRVAVDSSLPGTTWLAIMEHA